MNTAGKASAQLRMNRLTAGTLVRLSAAGKASAQLRAIPRDDIGLVLGHFVPKNHLGYPIGDPIYRIRWMNGYYPEHQCYRTEVKFADSDQMRMNKERIRSKIYASTVKAPR